MHQTALVTGGYGFLGRAVAKKLKQTGYRVIGLGNGRWDPFQALGQGFDYWLDASISLSSLRVLDEKFDLVVHCAGTGSVGYSIEYPMQDFQKTVQGTLELLEFLRVSMSTAVLVYPSSASVYGAKDDAPIHETDVLNPISPYGYHKRIAEELLESYSRTYGIRVVIVRFFSIYGPGLTKQLLWDACAKLSLGGTAEFWGTGGETRDWIHVEDAAELLLYLGDRSMAESSRRTQIEIFNGATGVRVTVRELLERLASSFGSAAEIHFNGVKRPGDPSFYHSDVKQVMATGWAPSILLDKGLSDYVAWVKTALNASVLGKHMDKT
jgi:UDP-glucose 4-epimerase